MLKHIITIRTSPQIFIWNPYIGRGMSITEASFDQKEKHPALKKRFQELGIDTNISNIHQHIPHRSRWSILVQNVLIHPIPSQRTSGGYIYQSIPLTPEQAQLWVQIDGKKSIEELAISFSSESSYIHSLLLPLCTHDTQAIQIRSKGLGIHSQALLQLFSPPTPQNIRKEHMYDQYGGTDLSHFHDVEIEDASKHFDDVEITLAHALEAPHPSLDMLPFGKRLAQTLLSKTQTSPDNILELGPGTGAIAEAWLSYHTPQKYIRMDASPTLLEAQKKRLPQTESLCAHAPAIPLPQSSIDVFICNEVIADLSAASIADPLAQEWIQKYDITLETEQNWVNLGAWKLLASIWNVLRNGGMAYISEFGDINEIPTEAIHLNHPEVSIHFGQLNTLAQKIGFQTELLSLPDFLKMDIQQHWMAKHSYCALRAYMHQNNKTLPAKAYSPNTLEFESIHGIEWVCMNELGPAPLPNRIWVLLLWKPVS